MINYYAVEDALRAHLTDTQVVGKVYSVNRLLDAARLFERVQPSPELDELDTVPYGAIILFFSGLDSVQAPANQSEACERSFQEWHLFVTTRYHGGDVERYTARKINGHLVSKVITVLKGFDWLKKYNELNGDADSRGSSVLTRVTADKLLVAEERSIEDPTIVSTLLAYRASLSSNWK